MTVNISDELRKLEPSPTNSEVARDKLSRISDLHEPREVIEWVGPGEDDFGKFDICSECMAAWPCRTHEIVVE